MKLADRWDRLTYEKIAADLKAQNYIEVPMGIPKRKIDEAVRHFFDFLSLPQEVKDDFYFILDTQDRGSNAGYARKARTKGASDDKEYFQYRLATDRVLASKIHAHRENPRVMNLLRSARALLGEASMMCAQVVRTIDAYHPGLYQKIFSPDAERLFSLRFLKYERGEKGMRLAKAHYDRGCCTLALAESAPGLRIGKDEASLKEVVREGRSAIFFPSFTFPEDIGSATFSSSWHDVVQKEEDVWTEDTARWSIIFFADSNVPHRISYEDAHTPRK